MLGADFEPRPQQLEMARAVAQAMETATHLLVEAGTGVGKSFAYLVPAVLRCLTRGEIVVIATNTISLQEQLIEKDIPLLQRMVAQLAEAGTPLLGPEGLPASSNPSSSKAAATTSASAASPSLTTAATASSTTPPNAVPSTRSATGP